MKIGIAAATAFEIEPTTNFLLAGAPGLAIHDFEILITGVGTMAATYELAQFIKTKSPGCMIQAGIAGSFKRSLALGETVLVRDELLADLGVEENNSFHDLFDMGFMQPDVIPYTGGRLVNTGLEAWKRSALQVVHGVTVNEITTRQERVEQLQNKYGCDLESMEGAAFHYVCLRERIPFLQLRSLSNYVGERDKKNWKLKDAVTSLNRNLIHIIQQL